MKPLRVRRVGPYAAMALACVAACVVACSPVPRLMPPCTEDRGENLLCGFTNPEDLALLPGESWLVVSQFAGEAQTGSLVGVRVSDGERRTLYPPEVGDMDFSAKAPVEGWGDPACPGPPDVGLFHPHGIDLLEGSGGLLQLAVVNHGGREAVELFEVGYVGGPALFWRGCVVMPENVWPNDVALVESGGFVVTDMFPSFGTFEGTLAGIRALFGGDTGEVLRWRPDEGLSVVPQSSGSAPNGIEVSRDGTQIYVAEWAAQKLTRIRPMAKGPEGRTSVDLPHHPDNVTWTRDGRLLVTGQVAGLGEVTACSDLEGEGTCGVPYSVVEVDPLSLDVRVLYEAEGAGTVALEVGSEIWVGTFAGDRIVRIPPGVAADPL